MDGRKTKTGSSNASACHIEVHNMILIKLRAISDSNAAVVQQRAIPPNYSRQIDKPGDNGLSSEEAVTDEPAQHRPRGRSIEDMTS